MTGQSGTEKRKLYGTEFQKYLGDFIAAIFVPLLRFDSIALGVTPLSVPVQ